MLHDVDRVFFQRLNPSIIPKQSAVALPTPERNGFLPIDCELDEIHPRAIALVDDFLDLEEFRLHESNNEAHGET